MVEAHAKTGGNVVAAMEVPHNRTSSYGVLDLKENIGSTVSDRLMAVKGMVEKPAVEDAPSNLAVIGRYILTPDVLNTLNAGLVGAGGEIQLTDAIAAEITARDNVFGYRFEGQRFDCGTKAGFLQATVAFGLARAELRDEFAEFLQNTTQHLTAAE